jgi:hypothetical protein
VVVVGGIVVVVVVGGIVVVVVVGWIVVVVGVNRRIVLTWSVLFVVTGRTGGLLIRTK